MKKLFGLIIAVLCFKNAFTQNRYDRIDSLNPQIGQLIRTPIYFDLDKSIIRADAAILLKNLLPLLTSIDSAVYSFEFYTDCRSSAEYNKDLSKRRADSAAAFLRRLSGDSLIIYAIGMGESAPLNDCICEGKNKQIYTRFTEDTVNGVPEYRKLYHYDSSKQLIEYSRAKIEQHIKNGDYFLTCSESEHQRNRRSLIRLVAFRKSK
ncbi:MAG TPA: OmpA family protein [Bacteroidia bacterium]